MINIRNAASVEQQYEYFHQLLAAFENDPHQAFASLLEHKSRISALMRSAKLKSTAQKLENADVAGLQYLFRKWEMISQLLNEVAAINDPRVLEQEAQKIKRSVPDPALATLLDTQVALLLTFPREIQMLRELAAQFEALETGWESAEQDPLPQVKKLFRAMRTDLPPQLRERYGDKETARYFETELQKPEYADPLPHPTTLKNVVLRAVAKLEQPAMFAQRFQVTKSRVIQDLQKEAHELRTALDTKQRKIREALEEYYHQLEIVMGSLNEDAEFHLQAGGELFVLLRATAEKIVLNNRILSVLASHQTEAAKQQLIIAALRRYRELIKRTNAAAKALKGINRFAKNRDDLAERALARA